MTPNSRDLTLDVTAAARPSILARLEVGRRYRNDRLQTANKSHKVPEPTTVRVTAELEPGLWRITKTAGPPLPATAIAAAALAFWRDVTNEPDCSIENG